MVLYHVISNYHLLNAIIHNSIYKKESVLVCSQWTQQRFENLKYLNKIFKNIIQIDMNYRFSHTEKETIKYFQGKIGNIKNFKEIYVWGAHFSFGISLIERKIPFIFCEDGSGLLSRSEILKSINEKDPVKKKLFKYLCHIGVFDGNNLCIKQKLCNVNAQIEGFIDDNNIINFNVIEEMFKLSENERKKILKFFNVNKTIDINRNSTLLLTQHFNNLQILTFENQALIYQLLVDYFFENENLVIKPHPDDIMYYSQLFPKAQILREKFPAEFMPFVFNNQPKCVATISSTAIFNLHGIYSDIFELDTDFEIDFKAIHKYYAALYLAKSLDKAIMCIGVNERLVNQLSKKLNFDSNNITYNYNKANKIKNKILLIDNIKREENFAQIELINMIKNLDEESVCIFINSRQDYCWYDYNHKYLWENIKPLVLIKDLYDERTEDFYSDLNIEILYIYSKSKGVFKMIDNIEINKNLLNTGISVKNVHLTPEQERIKILEGVLEATEKRLLYYIEKEKYENNKGEEK